MKTTKVLTIGILLGLAIAIGGISLVAYKSAPEDNPSAVEAVADGNVDQSVFPGNWNRWFRPFLRQRL